MPFVTLGKPERWWNQPIKLGKVGMPQAIKAPMGKAFKAGAIGGGVVAGLAALGIWAASSRSKAHERAKREEANADLQMEPLPPVMMPNMVQQQPQEQQVAPVQQAPQEAAGPAEGYQPNQWQNYVASGRGTDMQPQQAKNAAVNPKMNVVPESSVQDLGAPSTPTR